MEKRFDTQSAVNMPETSGPIGTRLAPLGSLDVLKATGRDLSRRRPHMPPDARPHASNLIEQIDNIYNAADAERLRPHMARAAELMAKHSGKAV